MSPKSATNSKHENARRGKEEEGTRGEKCWKNEATSDPRSTDP
jgi:hypothetical protein